MQRLKWCRQFIISCLFCLFPSLISLFQCVTRWCRGRQKVQQLVLQFVPTCAIADFEEVSVAGFQHVCLYTRRWRSWVLVLLCTSKIVHLCLIWYRVVRSTLLCGLTLSSLAKSVPTIYFDRLAMSGLTFQSPIISPSFTSIYTFQEKTLTVSFISPQMMCRFK